MMVFGQSTAPVNCAKCKRFIQIAELYWYNETGLPECADCHEQFNEMQEEIKRLALEAVKQTSGRGFTLLPVQAVRVS
jgi:hypothetical protein